MLLKLENPDLTSDSGACWQMTVEFTVERFASGDLLRGNAGDWLVQYAPGDHGIVAAARFDRVYRKVEV